jgi:arsenate reductase-like glutaredoxin family protein
MVCKEAKQIIDKFTGEHAIRKYHVKEPHRAKKIFDKLDAMAHKILSGKDYGNDVLNELKDVLLEQEITAFQFNQSGIPRALFTYLTEASTYSHLQRLYS